MLGLSRSPQRLLYEIDVVDVSIELAEYWPCGLLFPSLLSNAFIQAMVIGNGKIAQVKID